MIHLLERFVLSVILISGSATILMGLVNRDVANIITGVVLLAASVLLATLGFGDKSYD